MPRESPTYLNLRRTVRANSNRLAGLRSRRKRASCYVAILSYTSTCMAYTFVISLVKYVGTWASSKLGGFGVPAGVLVIG
jgi:hypothetical protein